MLDLSKEQFRELIDKISLFEFFTSEEKNLVADLKSNLVGRANGEYIIRQGETGHAVYLLIKGKAKITKNEKRSVALNILKPGDVFGEVAFFAQRPRATNVIALEDTVALKMDWSHFKEMDEVLKNKIKDKLIEVLIGRIEDMNKVLIEHCRR